MKTYGNIKYSTIAAPTEVRAFGICENYTYKKQQQVAEVADSGGIIVAMVPHGEKGDVSFSITPAGTATALSVRAGAALELSGLTGLVIVHSASAKWARGKEMNMDFQATHFPGIPAVTVLEGTEIAQATLTLSQGEAPDLVLPTGEVWFGTSGLAGPEGVTGIVTAASLTETVQLQEEEDNAGAIVACAVHGYKAVASMEIITTVALSDIDLGDTLTVFGGFRITSADEKYSKNGVHTIGVEGVLVPS